MIESIGTIYLLIKYFKDWDLQKIALLELEIQLVEI